MKNIIILTTMLLGAIANGCSVNKKFIKVDPEAPAQFRGTTSSDDTVMLYDKQVKDVFTDPILQKLIDTAIIKNYDMQIALKNIEASQRLFAQVKWDYLPRLDFAIGASRQRPSDNSITGLSLTTFNVQSKHLDDYATSFSLGWEADIWGKIRNRQKATLAGYLQTVEARNTIRTDLVASVASGYFNLQMFDDQLSIARKNVLLSDSTLLISKLQFDAGQVNSLAVQQAEAQQQVAKKLVPELEKNITMQENALSILAGRAPGLIERQYAKAEGMADSTEFNPGVPASLVSSRPDVKRAELALTIANSQVGIAKAELYPSLRITAEGGLNSFQSSNWFNIPASLFGIVGASVFQPVLDGKRLHTNYEVAKINREKSVLEFRQVVLTAVGDVSDALVKIEKLKSEEGIAAKRVSILQQAIINAEYLFKNGMANYLEVITAQSNVLSSELELASLKRDRMTAIAELYRSLGGGWK